MVNIAIVGDVHGEWSAQDDETLKALGVDLVLFVGDFGNEAVEIVRQVSHLSLPKAVMLGNHDAWYSSNKTRQQHAPYDRTEEDRVGQQIELLGNSFIGYRCQDFPELNLSVVGARPFSWGGPQWKHSRFYKERFGVHGMTESTRRILQALRSAKTQSVIIVGHNGPLGLGSTAVDPCGKDWAEPEIDYGDADLRTAIDIGRGVKQIPLVTFGHMHHKLRYRRDRLRRSCHCDQAGTVYVNAACVPRLWEIAGETVRHFALVTLVDGQVQRASQAWVNLAGQVLAETLVFDRRLGQIG
jgi:uncharacterized protein (TIGR04168 family)